MTMVPPGPTQRSKVLIEIFEIGTDEPSDVIRVQLRR